MAGEDEHLVSLGELDEGCGGTLRALRIEVHEDVIDDHWETGGTGAELTDEAKAQGQIEQILSSTAELTRLSRLCRLGRLFYMKKRMRDALPFYERAAELSPKWSEAWFGLGACQWALSHPAGAEAALRRAVELEPTDWQARQFLGCVLHDLGRKKDAREMLESVPLNVSWQKAALERMVAMAWWPQDAERRRQMESLWKSVMGGAPGRGAMDVLEEVSRKMEFKPQ